MRLEPKRVFLMARVVLTSSVVAASFLVIEPVRRRGRSLANIGDIARHLGVSRSTVSYALSGKRPVSRETKQRVEAAIRKLDYWPSAAGRALATARSEILALLYPMGASASPAIALQFVDGVARASRELGYDTLLITGNEGIHAVDRLTRARQVDGFILLDVEEDDQRLPALRRSKLPSVLVGNPAHCEDLDRVDLDWTAVGSVLVEQLAALGHVHIGVLWAPAIIRGLHMTYAEHFQQGVWRAVEGLDLAIVDVPAELDNEATYRGVIDALREHPELTAFVVQHEPAVAPLKAALAATDRSIPADVSIVGVNIDALDSGLVTPISGVGNPSRELTRAAVELLVARLNGDARAPTGVVISPAYTDRGTAGPAPALRNFAPVRSQASTEEEGLHK